MHREPRQPLVNLLYVTLTLLVVSACNDPLIILNVENTVDASQLQATVRLDDGRITDPTRGSGSRIAITLPADASGEAHIELFGLNGDGCKLAELSFNEPVPGGLGRWTEKTVKLNSVTPPICTSLPSGCMPGVWCSLNPPVEMKNLRAVTRFQGTEVLVVGDGGTMLRCNGASCAKLPAVTTENLYSAWWVDANNIYAVGGNGTILRCNPSVSSCTPVPSGTAVPLHSVWGNHFNNVYAVGDSGQIVGCSSGTCVPRTSVTSSDLIAVWGADANDVYAVGGGPSASAGVHCNATTCNSLGLGVGPNLAKAVSGINVSDVWLVAFGGKAAHCQATSCSTLNSNLTVNLFSVWATSGFSDGVGVGENGTVTGCGTSSCSEFSWLPAPPGLRPSATFSAVWGASASTIHVAGTSGLLASCDGNARTCQQVSSPTTQTLNAIWGSDADHVYIVGDNGTVLYRGI